MKEKKPLDAKRTSARLVYLAPVKLQAAVDKISANDRQRLANYLEGIAMAAMLRAGYIRGRSDGFNQTDHGHDKGVKNANRKLIAIRRLIGYTDPKSGAINF